MLEPLDHLFVIAGLLQLEVNRVVQDMDELVAKEGHSQGLENKGDGPEGVAGGEEPAGEGFIRKGVVARDAFQEGVHPRHGHAGQSQGRVERGYVLEELGAIDKVVIRKGGNSGKKRKLRGKTMRNWKKTTLTVTPSSRSWQTRHRRRRHHRGS